MVQQSYLLVIIAKDMFEMFVATNCSKLETIQMSLSCIKNV
jgi:hypothetical protein